MPKRGMPKIVCEEKASSIIELFSSFVHSNGTLDEILVRYMGRGEGPSLICAFADSKISSSYL